MQQRAISHYCQKCRAANPLGQEFCVRCGTPLMIVVHPPSARVDFTETTPHEEHLLERLTMLERSEKHTSELQSPDHLVCRLLLEKKRRETVVRLRDELRAAVH